MTSVRCANPLVQVSTTSVHCVNASVQVGMTSVRCINSFVQVGIKSIRCVNSLVQVGMKSVRCVKSFVQVGMKSVRCVKSFVQVGIKSVRCVKSLVQVDIKRIISHSFLRGMVENSHTSTTRSNPIVKSENRAVNDFCVRTGSTFNRPRSVKFAGDTVRRDFEFHEGFWALIKGDSLRFGIGVVDTVEREVFCSRACDAGVSGAGCCFPRS